MNNVYILRAPPLVFFRCWTHRQACIITCKLLLPLWWIRSDLCTVFFNCWLMSGNLLLTSHFVLWWLLSWSYRTPKEDEQSMRSVNWWIGLISDNSHVTFGKWSCYVILCYLLRKRTSVHPSKKMLFSIKHWQETNLSPQLLWVLIYPASPDTSGWYFRDTRESPTAWGMYSSPALMSVIQAEEWAQSRVVNSRSRWRSYGTFDARFSSFTPKT